ncbi:hypothetical protein CDAR_577051 [Caerostris darwini]|uniref:Uncharacterized protein n=1 Tax=Caerostris darwini TaxID=1538125 RepID=A0AAV4RJ85_9ARAC|nr:hypothetical protein CDAR_577051 [Caerostris darwini]
MENRDKIKKKSRELHNSLPEVNIEKYIFSFNVHKCWKVESISRNGSLNTPITVTQEWLGSIQIYGLARRTVFGRLPSTSVSCSLSYETHVAFNHLQNTDPWHLKVAPFVLQSFIGE